MEERRPRGSEMYSDSTGKWTVYFFIEYIRIGKSANSREKGNALKIRLFAPLNEIKQSIEI